MHKAIGHAHVWPHNTRLDIAGLNPGFCRWYKQTSVPLTNPLPLHLLFLWGQILALWTEPVSITYPVDEPIFCEWLKLKINAVNEQNQYLSTFMWVMKREFTVIKDSLHQDRKQTYCYQRYSRPRQRVYCYQRYSRPRQKESLLLSKIVYTKTERQFTVIKDILHLPKLTVYCYRRYSTPRQNNPHPKARMYTASYHP